MDLLKRMNLVLDYIENNLDGEIEENKIAMLFAGSKNMFQRIFTLMTETTLSEYIRKRKLTLAAFDIRNTNEKIIDIAVKYGYNSAVAFNSRRIFSWNSAVKSKKIRGSISKFLSVHFCSRIKPKSNMRKRYAISCY